MTHDNADDGMLASLSALRPDPLRSVRVRARCRAELERRRRRSERRDAAAALARRAAPVVVAGLSAWCLMDLLTVALQTLTLTL